MCVRERVSSRGDRDGFALLLLLSPSARPEKNGNGFGSELLGGEIWNETLS